VPVTVLGDEKITGFDLKRLTALTKKGSPLPLDPKETIPLIAKVLEAVERAARQMPADKFSWSLPQRKRPMGELVYHIFLHARLAMEELETGAATTKLEGIALPYSNFREIADFGKNITAQYNKWAATANPGALSQGSNKKTGAEILDLVAGQISHHLRQLYFLLESWGIEPETKLKDSDLPAEYVLKNLW
jgi:hypothetical protein